LFHIGTKMAEAKKARQKHRNSASYISLGKVTDQLEPVARLEHCKPKERTPKTCKAADKTND